MEHLFTWGVCNQESLGLLGFVSTSPKADVGGEFTALFDLGDGVVQPVWRDLILQAWCLTYTVLRPTGRHGRACTCHPIQWSSRIHLLDLVIRWSSLTSIHSRYKRTTLLTNTSHGSGKEPGGRRRLAFHLKVSESECTLSETGWHGRGWMTAFGMPNRW